MPRLEREQRMLDAAEEIFGRRGFRAASMDEIAEHSGVTKPLVYQDFGSKDEIYEACVERARARFMDEVETAVATVAPADALGVFTERFFTHIAQHRGAWWLLYGETAGTALSSMRGRNADVIRGMLERVLEDTVRTLDGDTLDLLAHFLVGAGEQAGRWWVDRPDVPLEQVVAHFRSLSQGAARAAFAGSQPAPAA
jgi:AcrR family transcriptional regulator